MLTIRQLKGPYLCKVILVDSDHEILVELSSELMELESVRFQFPYGEAFVRIKDPHEFNKMKVDSCVYVKLYQWYWGAISVKFIQQA